MDNFEREVLSKMDTLEKGKRFYFNDPTNDLLEFLFKQNNLVEIYVVRSKIISYWNKIDFYIKMLSFSYENH